MSLNNLTQEINNIQTCAELQRALTKVEAAIAHGLEQLIASNAELAALQALLTPPSADLTKIVTWITNFISQYIGVDIINLEKMIQQQIQLQLQLVALVTAITSKASQLEHCNLFSAAIPSLPSLPSLPKLPSLPSLAQIPSIPSIPKIVKI